MKAKIISGAAPGGARTRLADVLPLDTPMVFQFFPVYACNFKCKYCTMGLPKEQRGFISDVVKMDTKLFLKVITGISRFPHKIKVVRFVGTGEPLLHPLLPAMVAGANLSNAIRVELITNGSLLTNDKSDALIGAGLDRLVVSVQGTSAEKYYQTSGVKIDFQKFVDNLRYFYEHKKNTHVYIKIMDSVLDGPEDEQRFYDIFGNICDSIGVEHTVPIHQCLDNIGEKPLTQFGLPVSEVPICPQPFIYMQVNPDGKVTPCFSFEYPEIMGDANKESVVDIWNGKKFQDFRRAHLDGRKNVCKTCADCQIMKYRMFPEDDLSQDVDRLKGLYA